MIDLLNEGARGRLCDRVLERLVVSPKGAIAIA